MRPFRAGPVALEAWRIVVGLVIAAVVGLHANASARAAGEGVYYKNCAEARLAGVAPIRRGEPGYGRHLDRDGDGIACE